MLLPCCHSLPNPRMHQLRPLPYPSCPLSYPSCPLPLHPESCPPPSSCRHQAAYPPEGHLFGEAAVETSCGKFAQCWHWSSEWHCRDQKVGSNRSVDLQ